MITEYYKRKTFIRAEGILDSFLIADRRYAWGVTRPTLMFFIPSSVEEDILNKVAEAMQQAFRKAKCTVGPFLNPDRLKDGVKDYTRTLVITFKDDDKGGSSMKKCSICGRMFSGYGHNPEPVKRWIDGSCCGECNIKYVIPARINENTNTKEV